MSKKFYLTIFVIWQLFSTALIATGAWPQSIVFVNLAIQIAALFFFDLEYALYSAILSLPFYLAVPNAQYSSLSAWRPVFLVLFFLFAFRKVLSSRPSPLGAGSEKKGIEYFSWDKYLLIFLVVALISLIEAKFKVQGLKKIIFVLNAYFIYVVAFNVIRSREQLKRLIFATFAAIAIIVLLGYVQFFSTFAASTYNFWQYWALLISKAYYGPELSDTLTYSNSWFSFYSGQPPALRMFSILPDSHSFAVIAMFSILYASSILYFVSQKHKRVLLWIFIGLAALALTIAGTRGIWAAIIAPLAVCAYFYYRHFGRKIIAPMFIPIALFLVFIIASPLVQKVYYSVSSTHTFGNLLERAETIYDIKESSNVGRLSIWKNDLKFLVRKPFLGTGYGNFINSLPQADVKSGNGESYQSLGAKKEKGFNLPLKYITAHSLYGDVLVETGIIGFLFFVYYFREILRRIWNFFKKFYLFSGEGFVFFVAGTGVYMIWFLAYSVFDGTFYNDRVLIIFFLILAACARAIELQEPESNA